MLLTPFMYGRSRHPEQQRHFLDSIKSGRLSGKAAKANGVSDMMTPSYDGSALALSAQVLGDSELEKLYLGSGEILHVALTGDIQEYVALQKSGKKMVLTTFSSALISELDIVLLGLFYSGSVLGVLAWSRRILEIIFQLLSQSADVAKCQ